ncbi:hypothetical protein CCP3SC15_420028 [Gammaproteobacteria bacterium]
MTQWLKQSTAATIKMGPFLDDTDGKTAETGLTISQADIRLTKNGADVAQTHNAAGATHDEGGFYDIPLDTTDTNTLGRLKVFVEESGSLPVWQDFMVVPANVWDSMFGAAYLQVDLTQIATAAVSASTAQLGVNVVNWKGSAAAAMTGDAYAEAALVHAHAAGAETQATAAAASLANGGFTDLLIDGIKTKTDYLPSATAGSAGGVFIAGSNAATSITTALTANITGNLSGTVGTVTTLTNLPTIPNDWLAAAGVKADAVTKIQNGLATPTNITAGTITTATNVTTVNGIGANVITAASIAADAGAEIADSVWDEALAGHATGGSAGAALSAATAPSAATVADAVWDEALSGHSTAGTAGLALATASSGGVDPSVLADAIWDEALSGHSTAGTSGKKLTDLANADLSGVATATNLATVDTVVDAIKLKTDNLPASPAAVGSNMGTVSSVTGSVGSVTAGVTVTTNSDKTGYALTAAYDAAKTAATATSVSDVSTLVTRALGLAQENFRISSPVFSGTNMTSCTVKIYPTATDCTNDTNVTATYAITATYDGSDNLSTYKSVKV